jgi:hypothetical protein
MNFQYYRRGYRKFKEHFKYAVKTKEGRKIIKISVLVHDITRVIYNPFYLIDITRRMALQNIMSVI